MKRLLSLPVVLIVILLLTRLQSVHSDSEDKTVTMKNVITKYADLSPKETRVIVDKGTELPFTGDYWNFSGDGVYTCRSCGADLYRSKDKINTECGWPGFDDEVSNSVRRQKDADGVRTEILCNNCGAHLGHVFEGEKLTPKNLRHCVNSVSVNFVSKVDYTETETAYFAGGCFWGVEYWFQEVPGVIETEVGYMGGQASEPSYEEVCTGATGHAEALKVVFRPAVVSYEKLARLFFEIHDPTQLNRQGPDRGEQYRSAVFFTEKDQQETVGRLIEELKSNGLNVVTELEKADTFYPAEEYHQEYYSKTSKTPYCHSYAPRF